MKTVILLCSLIWGIQGDQSAFRIKAISKGDGSCHMLEESILSRATFLTPENNIQVFRDPTIREIEPASHERTLSPEEVIEVVGFDKEKVHSTFEQLCPKVDDLVEKMDGEAAAEVRKVVDSGPPENRIDVVFMGDGYTTSEKDKFFNDIGRLTQDMFQGTSFVSQLPLFNVWAVYIPSSESGIGAGGRPKDSTFGLYRDGTELRAIYCSKPDAARRACKLTGNAACDYPSLIGNDDYYGGLGGEFAISTSSHGSGSIVLRHEFGHNFIKVGEEYDNGYVYSGVNSVSSINSNQWEKWLTDPTRRKEERSRNAFKDYPWYDLAEGPYIKKFTTDGKFQRWTIYMTASGVEEDGSMEVYLDGKRLPWTSKKNLDRHFHQWEESKEGFKPGSHTLEVRQGFPRKTDRIRQVCSVTIMEYGDESEFKADNNVVSFYATVDIRGTKTYRPTNEGCLMRNMSHPYFCSVCKEGMWRSFLSKISLIDSVEVSCSSNGDVNVGLKPLKLAQFRTKSIEGERYEVTWFKNNQAVSEHNNKFDITLPKSEVNSQWKVKLAFFSPEVRYDPGNVMKAEKTVNLKC